MRSQRTTPQRAKKSFSLFSLLLIISLLFPPMQSVQGRNSVQSSQLEATQSSVNRSQFDEPNNGEGGLTIRLSEGAEQPDAVSRPPLADPNPLNADEVQLIADRLPALEGEAEDVQEFRLPPDSPPPPRTGDTLDEAFPPQQDVDASDVVTDGPLEVLRFAPDGDVPIAPFINVTFNQPMVPLGTLAQLAAADVPVQVTPAIEGEWKWLGTRTLSFEAASDEVDRLPMATEFTVEIPAGTESANGGILEEAIIWTFRTPPPTVQNFAPTGSPQPLDPIFFAGFDQRIDPEAVLDTISVTAGGQEYPVRLATEEELADDTRAASLSKNSPEGRWLTFRTVNKLPTNTTVNVNIGPGTPSAEGPRVTESVQAYSFQTYAPLQIFDHRCGYGNNCPPFSPFLINFNNGLDEALFDPSLITVEPEIPNVNIQQFGNTIQIRGATSGRTTYEVTVSGDILDTFGQTLGADETLTFEVGSAEPSLSGPRDMTITLDPSSATPVFTVYSINYSQLRYRAYLVEPSDWSAYQSYRRDYHNQEKPPEVPGREVINELIDIQSQPDELAETAIDLSDALNGAQTGHLVVVVDVPQGILSKLFGNSGRRIEPAQSWVQITQIGLDAVVDQSTMIAWANGLTDGAPLTDVELTLAPNGPQATTGTDGTATIELPSQNATLLVAQKSDDIAFLPQRPWSYYGDEGWREMPVRDELRWYVWDDRQMYKPGEEVHVKGWLRKIGGDINGDVGLLDGQQTVSYRVMGAQGNDITDGEATVNAAGGFDLNFTLPENANLGHATLQLTASGSVSNLNSRDHWHNFQIQEFRRPEFEVSAGNETTGPYFVGDEGIVFVQASYFSGGPLPNAETFWNVSSSPTNYSPPGWGDYTFGTWTPWWYFDDFYGGGGGSAVESYNSATDASGAHYLKLNFDAATNPRPYSVSTDATVMDVNRQAWSASTNLMVHPSNLYVGIQSERTFVKRGEPLEVEAVVVDVDGAATGGQQISMIAARLQWKNTNGRWMEEEVDPQECAITSSAFPAENPVTCTFSTDRGGRYRITATVEDEEGRLNQSQFTRWVSGGKRPPARNVEQEEANLIPDKEEYQPGDVAEILVQSPFAPAEGMMTVARNGILYTERFEMAEESIVLQVPIEDEHIPNLIVQIDLVGSAPRLTDDGEPAEGVPPRPAYASGRLDLSIPPLSRTLALDVAPQDEATEPGAETALDVTLSDANGEPVAGAELAVIVVDEAVLALTNYQLADPLAVFYGSRHDNTSSYHSRSSIVLTNPELLAEQGMGGGEIAATAMPQAANMMRSAAAAPMADGEAMEESASDESLMAFDAADDSATSDDSANAPAIDLRTNFNPLALFAPEVTTDADGKATVDITLPDNLTRYRVMVVAVADGNKFGSGESNITARLPLMVRPSAPRFLNFGDRFELPIVIQNQTGEDTEVDVVVRASNIDLVDGEDVPGAEIDSSGQRITVPANDRVEVRFPAATLSAGTARFQIAISSDTFADAATADLPVYTPATTEAFATYGVIDEGAIVQPVAAPEDVFPQFGALEIDTSSTALQALTDALIYLTSYPYDCSEQIASRIMAVGALRDVLTAFDAEGLPTPAEMEAAVERDVERLASLQNNDGGYPIWQRGRESVPYYSIFVPHALHIAKEKGFAVSNKQQIQALSYLRDIESYYPRWYSQRTRYSLSAYALYVRGLLGDVDTTKANNLFAETGLDEMPLEGLAWLLHIFSNDASSAESAAEIRRHIGNRAVETAGAANFTTSYGDDEWVMLHSNRRTDGVILDALITDQPESDLIPKVVTGLLAHRERGRWNNTQENAFILLALDRYFNTFEAETPDFVANIWLGEDFVGGHEYVGRTTDRRSTDVPMSYLVDESGDNALKDLVINKEGDGRLYYRLGLRYAPTDLDMPPIDRGFVVQRTYEAVDDPDDVKQGEDGTWQIKAGARVRVRLTMIADNRRYHVALVDPLAAGLEIVNPALAVSQEVPSDPNDSRSSSWWWYGTWYNHQNLRDERAEAFANLLWDGVHNYTYIARATTPGEFIVPPAKAEEMYSPEVFGRSGSDRVVVVDPGTD